MKIKRIFAVFLVAVIVISFMPSVFAQSAAVLYGNPVSTSPNSIFFVPVSVKNNAGLMGFKVTVTYDAKILSYPVVTRGKITSNGLLNDSIGVSQEGSFDVVWSGDSEVQGDGTLFTISFSVDATEAEGTKLSFKYSPDDTFNEAYEDVELLCNDIAIDFGGGNNSGVYAGEPKEPTGDNIVIAVDSAFREYDISTVQQLDPDFGQEFLVKVNNALSIMTGTEDYFYSLQSISEAYVKAKTDRFVTQSIEAVNVDQIETAVQTALQTVQADSIDSVPEQQCGEFVKTVEQELIRSAPDLDSISDKLEPEDAVAAVRQLLQAKDEARRSGKGVPTQLNENIKRHTKIWFFFGIIAVVILVTVVMLIIKRKKRTNKTIGEEIK